MIALIVAFLLVCQQTSAWEFAKVKVVGNLKKNIATAVVLASSLSFATPNAYAANDALTGAMNAMTAVKEKSVVERDFASLPEGAKKRRAVLSCKDSSMRDLAGFKSAADCTNAVLQGDYSVAVGVNNRPQAAPKQVMPKSRLESLSFKGGSSSSESEGAGAGAESAAAVAALSGPRVDVSGA
jgi:hypothetical protein